MTIEQRIRDKYGKDDTWTASTIRVENGHALVRLSKGDETFVGHLILEVGA